MKKLIFILVNLTNTIFATTIWIEAENMKGLKGSFLTSMPYNSHVVNSWALSGPGVAPEWTQGSESNRNSIATSKNSTKAEVWYEFILPEEGKYFLWVRYADWFSAKETFKIKIVQQEKNYEFKFGEKPIIDELDQLKVFWGWCFGWDKREVELEAGKCKLFLIADEITDAPRQIDVICLTTDKDYRPFHLEKPNSYAWEIFEKYKNKSLPLEPIIEIKDYKISDRMKLKKFKEDGLLYCINTFGDGIKMWEELVSNSENRILYPYALSGEPIIKEFKNIYSGKKDIPIFSYRNITPVIYLSQYPSLFLNNSPFLKWLDRNPDKHFAILINYASPNFSTNPDEKIKQQKEAYENFIKYKDRFIGYIAGESLGNFSFPENATDKFNEKIKNSKNVKEIYDALKEYYTIGTNKYYSDIYGKEIENGWEDVISCNSWRFLCYLFPLFEWGCKTVGHENTSDSFLPLRLAYLRGGARQFGGKFLAYRSCNFGDSATIFNDYHYFYTGSRCIYDNWYDMFSGAGMDWYKKDIFLYYLQGVSAIYDEEGIDYFWKPGGQACGLQEFQLSPKGKIIQKLLEIVEKHPDPGIPFTPIAFFVDLKNGFDIQTYNCTYFDLPRDKNEKILIMDDENSHMLGQYYRGAYYPLPKIESEIFTGSRQSFVNGIFGDIFDVICNSEKYSDIILDYPVIIPIGDVYISETQGRLFQQFLKNGNTLLITSQTLYGPGLKYLPIPKYSSLKETNSFIYRGEEYKSEKFRYEVLEIEKTDKILVETPDKEPIVIVRNYNNGKIIYIGIPKGLTLDLKLSPVVAIVFANLFNNILPFKIEGNIHFGINKLSKNWLIWLINNEGVYKPQHGITPTKYNEEQIVKIISKNKVNEAVEWLKEEKYYFKKLEDNYILEVMVPAGGIRILEIK